MKAAAAGELHVDWDALALFGRAADIMFDSYLGLAPAGARE
jgi:hypothetical protein